MYLCATGIFDDSISPSDLARRPPVLPREPQRDPQPQTVRPHVDAGRVHTEPQGRTISHDHRSEPAHPPVAGRHDTLQPAPDVDPRLRHGPQQVPDGSAGVRHRIRQL